MQLLPSATGTITLTVNVTLDVAAEKGQINGFCLTSIVLNCPGAEAKGVP